MCHSSCILIFKWTLCVCCHVSLRYVDDNRYGSDAQGKFISMQIASINCSGIRVKVHRTCSFFQNFRLIFIAKNSSYVNFGTFLSILRAIFALHRNCLFFRKLRVFFARYPGKCKRIVRVLLESAMILLKLFTWVIIMRSWKNCFKAATVQVFEF